MAVVADQADPASIISAPSQLSFPLFAFGLAVAVLLAITALDPNLARARFTIWITFLIDDTRVFDLHRFRLAAAFAPALTPLLEFALLGG